VGAAEAIMNYFVEHMLDIHQYTLIMMQKSESSKKNNNNSKENNPISKSDIEKIRNKLENQSKHNNNQAHIIKRHDIFM
jgi:hypothetical protein